MKSIDKLTLKNFKFFVDEESLDFDCKNVLVYGENGSGKSSLYWALYTFLQSSIKTNEEIKKYFDKDNSQNLINRFINDSDKADVFVSLDIKDENSRVEQYRISNDIINTNQQDNTQIFEANSTSDFINYKLLSRFYDFRNSEEMNIWNLFEKEILEYITIDNKNLKKSWDSLKDGLGKVDNKYPAMKTQTYIDFEDKLQKFNSDMNTFLVKIIRNTNDILEENFKEKISITLKYDDAIYNDFVEGSKTKRSHLVKIPQIILKVKFNDEDIDKPHTFLNEAKLTAIALSLRFAILKTRLVGDDILKILVLDDLLISLDMSHRLEVINIILNDDDLKEYQKIILTHDRGFFNLLNQKVSHLDWKIFEFYNQDEKQCIKEHKTELDRARELFENSDFEASANYLRKETENILKNFLDPNLKHINREFKTLEDLINRVKNELEESYKNEFDKIFKFKGFDEVLLSKIDTDFENDETLDKNQKGKLRGFNKKLLKFTKKYHTFKTTEFEILDELKNIKNRVLNPLSHKSEAPIFKKEVEDAIELIGKLKEFLKDKKSKKTIETARINCTPTNNNTEETISENLDGFVVNFREDVLDKLVEIKTTEALNEFLKNLDLVSISTAQLDNIFTELRFAQKLELFDLDTDATLVRLFIKKQWSINDKKVWCKFIKYLDENNIIKDRLVINKLKEEKCLEVEYYNYNNGEEYMINCDFLDRIISPPQYNQPPQQPPISETDIPEDEIPF